MASFGDCTPTLAFGVDVGDSLRVELALLNLWLNQYSFCMNYGSRKFPHTLDLYF